MKNYTIRLARYRISDNLAGIKTAMSNGLYSLAASILLVSLVMLTGCQRNSNVTPKPDHNLHFSLIEGKSFFRYDNNLSDNFWVSNEYCFDKPYQTIIEEVKAGVGIDTTWIVGEPDERTGQKSFFARKDNAFGDRIAYLIQVYPGDRSQARKYTDTGEQERAFMNTVSTHTTVVISVKTRTSPK